MPGVRRPSFSAPLLPPHSGLLPIIAAAEAAREDGDAAAFEEVALRLAGAVAAVLAGTKGRTAGAEPRVTSGGSPPRCAGSKRRPHEPLSLADLAHEAAMSPYHFLRSFRAVVGMTPHQFVLHTRLHRAAVRLRRTADSISAIAFAAGFNDLSTFNRRFQRIMGLSPSAYRASSPR